MDCKFIQVYAPSWDERVSPNKTLQCHDYQHPPSTQSPNHLQLNRSNLYVSPTIQSHSKIKQTNAFIQTTTSAQPPGPPSNATSPSSAPPSPAHEPSSPNSSPTSSQPAAMATAAERPGPPAQAAACSPATTPKYKHPSSEAAKTGGITIWTIFRPRARHRAVIARIMGVRVIKSPLRGSRLRRL